MRADWLLTIADESLMLARHRMKFVSEMIHQ